VDSISTNNEKVLFYATLPLRRKPSSENNCKEKHFFSARLRRI